jgi:hypothetical protein
MHPALLLVALLTPADARFGVALDLKTYPQRTPKEALASVLKAAAAGQFDYLAAQLADPVFVDDRVKRLYGGDFKEQVADTRARLDPRTLKELKRFLAQGKWTTEQTGTIVRLDEVKDRQVKLVKKGARWYLEHPSRPPRK